jgi:hypothetical protein
MKNPTLQIPEVSTLRGHKKAAELSAMIRTRICCVGEASPPIHGRRDSPGGFGLMVVRLQKYEFNSGNFYAFMMLLTGTVSHSL